MKPDLKFAPPLAVLAALLAAPLAQPFASGSAQAQQTHERLGPPRTQPAAIGEPAPVARPSAASATRPVTAPTAPSVAKPVVGPAGSAAEKPVAADAAKAAPAVATSASAPADAVQAPQTSPVSAPAESTPLVSRPAAPAQPASAQPESAPAPAKPQSAEAAPPEPAPVDARVQQAAPKEAASKPEPAAADPAMASTAAAPAGAADPAPAAASATPAATSAAPSAVAAETAVPPPPSAFQVALREAVERMSAAPIARAKPGQTPAAALRREREGVAAFYAARDFAPLWIAGETFTPAARSAIARIERAREDGLDLAQYTPPALDDASPEALARSELALSLAIAGYARQARGVRINPRSIGLITAKPDIPEPEEVLAAVAAAANVGAALAAYNPPQAGYAALRDQLEVLRRERPAVATPRIGPGRVLRVGMKDPRVPLVRARFGIDAAADSPNAELVYDTRVASAVADFQRAHGLPANGALTARTIALLSGGDPMKLERAVLASMEKWRWAPRDMGSTRIEVNIPDYSARVIRDGKVVHSMRVIVGKPETPTPVFSDTMRFMVVNPSWHIPQSIIRKQMAKDPSYYARNGYEVVQRGRSVFVRQPPGERNALGFVKFMFPNDHAVYLHDTPSRRLFGASRRAFSHGCVRVDKPFDFAEALAEETGWSGKRLRALIGKGERTLRFQQHVPVHLMYFAAFVDDDGKLQLRDDLYGHSRKLQTALGL